MRLHGYPQAVRLRRILRLASVGLIGAIGLTLGAASYVAGWAATRQELVVTEDDSPAEVYGRLVTGWKYQPGVPNASAAVHDF
jgi:hypothetical protein